jgi:3-isopropylmalate/(R)-2-methylmalate dehydratase small subunit
MIPINILTSTAVPLPLPNIDTDQIIPKQFLKRIERTGYGDFLFYDWRRIQDGPDAGKPDPSFVLNNPAYAGSQILIAERNFGCGSSREHAAWALNQYGFLAVIAPTFADIFFSNAGKNGTINLEAQTVTDASGFSAHFEIDPFRKYCLLNGLDDIGLTLRHSDALDKFESAHDKEFWSTPKLATATSVATTT